MADYYTGGVAGLALPAPAVIVQVQVLRGVLHLAAVLPVLLVWRGSRRRLVAALTSAS
ncbi:MAG: hypothetical protein AB1806_11510 [Acidobacteriota bacterium]